VTRGRVDAGQGLVASRLDRSGRPDADEHRALPWLRRRRSLDDYRDWQTDADRPRWPLALRDVPRGRSLQAAPVDEPWSHAIAAGLAALIVSIVIVAWTSVQ